MEMMQTNNLETEVEVCVDCVNTINEVLDKENEAILREEYADSCFCGTFQEWLDYKAEMNQSSWE